MKFRILLILLLVGVTSQAQNTYTKWALEAGGGIHGSAGPYTPGYGQGDINLPQVFAGGRFMFNETIGLRANLGYLSMSEADQSNEFQSSYWRGSLEGLLDVNRLFELWNPDSRFTILLHAGGGLSRMNYDFGNTPPETNEDRADNLLHFTGGIMPQYRISESVSLFADVSYFQHMAQTYTWDGYDTTADNGGIWMLSIGIVFNLKTARSRWDCRSLYR